MVVLVEVVAVIFSVLTERRMIASTTDQMARNPTTITIMASTSRLRFLLCSLCSSSSPFSSAVIPIRRLISSSGGMQKLASLSPSSRSMAFSLAEITLESFSSEEVFNPDEDF